MALPAPQASNLEASLEALHEASFGWARSCCDGDADDASDVLQSAYVKVLSGAARFAGASSFRTWLFGVIRLTALESRRRRWRELPIDGMAEPMSSAPAADAALAQAEEHAALRLAVARLPDRQREVLHLVFQQEMSVAEAAAAMGVSVGSARVHYDRAKRRLRALLGGNAGGADDGTRRAGGRVHDRSDGE
jgi:RNA polymerase sigma factor (sigma-70 family)